MTSAEARPSPRSEPRARQGQGDTVERLSTIRRLTAEHMVTSKGTAPHAYTVVEVDYEQVDRARLPRRASWRQEEGFSLTYLPFIARAVIDTLVAFPRLNATVGEGELTIHNYVNLAVAVDLDFEGLLAPVIHAADGRSFREVARAIDDLASRARSKRVTVDDLSGGTFTISNSGSFGTHLVLPIINQPQVAILSTDGVTRKPVVVPGSTGEDTIVVHPIGLLGLSWDHRALDGAYAAAFLREVKQVLEARDWSGEIS